MNTKKFLVFAGEQFYANGGANDLVSTSCKTEERAINYAKQLLGQRFSTHRGDDGVFDVSSPVEWVQVYDLDKCEVIFRAGAGAVSGVVIL